MTGKLERTGDLSSDGKLSYTVRALDSRKFNVEGKNTITIEYFLDHSMIEVYLNQKKAMTLRNYVAGGERKISVSSSGTNARVSSIQLWNMQSAYDEKES